MTVTSQLLERPARRSDERLVRRAKRGDRQALGPIFERYQQELYRFCLGLLAEPQDAEDALQNTMVKALRALPGEKREIALRPWLYRIAHNEAIELRRRRRDTQALDGSLRDAGSSVPDRAEQRERLQWVLKDLGELPERQRSVLVMRELSGLDFAEIGAALGTSGAVVRQTLYEARRNLEQMDFGRNLGCEAVTQVLSDGDGRISGRREIRAHLRGCRDCRRFQERIRTRKAALAGIAPLPPVAAAGIMQSALGVAGGGAGGVAAAVGGGAAGSVGVSGALKALATVAVVAAVGTAVEQRAHRQDAGAAPPAAASHAPRSTRASGPATEKPGRSPSPAAGVAAGAVPPSAADPGETLGGRRSTTAPRSDRGPAGIGSHPVRPSPGDVSSGTGDAAGPGATEPGAAGVPQVAVEPAPDAYATPAAEGTHGPETARGEPGNAAGKPEHPEHAEHPAHAQGTGAPAAQPGGHPAHPAHPEHPPHPAQSQKPAAEVVPAAPGEAAAEPAAAPATAESEGEAPEAAPGSAHGKAKGKEKKLASE